MDISSLRHEVNILVNDQRRELQKGDWGPKLVVFWMEGGSDCRVSLLWNKGTKNALQRLRKQSQAWSRGWRRAHQVMREARVPEERTVTLLIATEVVGWGKQGQAHSLTTKDKAQQPGGSATVAAMFCAAVTPNLLLHWRLEGQGEMEWGEKNKIRKMITDSKGVCRSEFTNNS